MADRQLKIVIRTEVQKGFGEINKQLADLTKSLQGLSGLQGSLNNLVKSFDQNNAFKKVAKDSADAAKSQKAVNDQIRQGIALAKSAMSDKDKLLSALNKINAAEKAGKVTAEQRLTAEIKLTNDLIKKTNDLSVLQEKGGRNSRGQFQRAPLSRDAVSALRGQNYTTASTAVRTMLPKPGEADKLYAAYAKEIDQGTAQEKTALQRQIDMITDMSQNSPWSKLAGEERSQLAKYYKGLKTEITDGSDKLIADIDTSAARIKIAMSKLVTPGPLKGVERTRMQNTYNDLFGAVPEQRPTSNSYGGGFGGGGSRRAGASEEEINPPALEGIKKLTDGYTKLGRTLFELQYSTYTLFAVTGLEALTKFSDEYTRLNNEIARTADTQDQIKAGTSAVFDIAAKTFTNPNDVAKTYSTINTYAPSLGMNQSQVQQATLGISSAVAISPGDSYQKTRGMRELTEVMNTNKFGGQQARSLMMELPALVQEVSQHIAEKQGKPPGSSVNLTEKGTHYGAKDIIDTFTDPKVIDKNLSILSDRAKTFDNIFTLVQGRFEQYIGDTKNSFGILQHAINYLASFLQDKAHFATLMNGIQSAGVGLAALGTAMLAQATFSVVGGLAGGAAKSLNVGKNFAMASNDAETYVGARALARTTGADLKSGVITGEQAGQRMATSDAAFEKLTPAMQKLIPFIEESSGAFVGLSLALEVVGGLVAPLVIAFALVAARFNFLLGQVHGGVGIFDIIGGLFTKLWGYMNDGTTSIGAFTSGLIGLIDKILHRAVLAANDDPDIRNAQLKNMTAGKGVVYQGQVYEARKVGQVAMQVPDTMANMAMDPTGMGGGGMSLATKTVMTGGRINMVPVGKAAKGISDTVTATTNAAGGRSFTVIPETQPGGFHATGTGVPDPNKNAADRSFSIKTQIDKMISEATEAEADAKKNDPWSAIGKAVREKVSGFQAQITDAMHEATKKGNTGEVAKLKSLGGSLDTLTAKLTSEQLQSGVRKFNDSLTELEVGLSKKFYDASLAKNSSEQDTFTRSAIKNLSNTGDYINQNVTPSQITSLLNNINDPGSRDQRAIGSRSGGADLIGAAKNSGYFSANGLTQLARIQTDQASITAGNQNIYRQGTADIRQDNTITGIAEQFGGGNKGSQMTSYLNTIKQFRQEFSTSDQDATVLEDRLKAVQEQFEQLDKYNSDWKNGAAEAFNSYIDGAKNAAAQTKQAFDNAFNSLTETFTKFIETGKFNFHDLAKSILGDLTTMFVKQNITGPLVKGASDLFNKVTGRPGEGGPDAAKAAADKLLGGKAGVDGIKGAMSVQTINAQILNVAGSSAAGGASALGGASKFISPASAAASINMPNLNLATPFDQSGINMSPVLPDGINSDVSGSSSVGLGSNVMGMLGKLGGGLGSLLGSAGGGISSGIGSAVSFLAGIFHEGGTVGSGGRSGMYNSSLFEGAQRYHTGGTIGNKPLASGEVPAILKRGEQVYTAQQNAAINARLSSPATHFNYAPQVTVNYHAAANSGSNSSAQTDPNDISSKLQETLDTHFNQSMYKAGLPGGLLYNKVAQN